MRCCFLFIAALFVASPAWGQRVQFPSMVAPPANGSSGAPGTTYRVSPAYQSSSPPAFQSSPQPSYPSSPPNYQSAAPPTLQSSPPTTFQGGFQPPSASWDPYADPTMQGSGMSAPPPAGYYSPSAAPAQPPLYPDGSPSLVPPGYPQNGSMLGQVTRLVQEVRVQDTWLLGDNGDDLDINTLEFSATLAFPFFYNQAPLLVTPGAAVHWFEGPEDTGPEPADLPPRVYDVFVDTAFQPALTERVSADLGVRVGAFTDFDSASFDSIRLMFRALAVLTYSPTTTFKLGAIYIDRNETKVLPAGGVVYTPNPDTRYEIIFPRPKLAQRLTTVGTTNVWGYVAGEYGGGSWTIERADGTDDSVDYNDLRVMLGLELLPETLSGRKAHFELGYVFNRELLYESDRPEEFEPSNTFLVRVGTSF